MYIGKEPIVGNFQKCDAITVVNGQAAYTLQVSSTNVVPESANHMLVSLNGILQAPVTSFTVSSSTLTFASNLATGDVIDFVILLGNVLDLGTPSDGTVTNAKLAQDIISGETALASEPADTDEFLVSDAGTLKRIDYSLIKGGGSFDKLATVTISSGVSSVAVDGNGSWLDNSTYAGYIFYIKHLSTSNDSSSSVVNFRVNFSGTAHSGSNYYAFYTYASGDSGSVTDNSAKVWGAAEFGLSFNNMDAEVARSGYGTIELLNTGGDEANGSGSYYPNMRCDFFSHHGDSANLYYYEGMGHLANAAPLSGITLIPSGGNLDGGEILVYGRKK